LRTERYCGHGPTLINADGSALTDHSAGLQVVEEAMGPLQRRTTMNNETAQNQSRPQPTKSATVSRMLGRNLGATLPEIMAATSWQPHSCRAFLSGLRKRGVTLLRESRKDGETSYRIGR